MRPLPRLEDNALSGAICVFQFLPDALRRCPSKPPHERPGRIPWISPRVGGLSGPDLCSSCPSRWTSAKNPVAPRRRSLAPLQGAHVRLISLAIGFAGICGVLRSATRSADKPRGVVTAGKPGGSVSGLD